MRPDRKNTPPTAQDAPGGPKITGKEDDEDAESSKPADHWLELARTAYDNSTTYVNESYRKSWDDSLRAFNNEHPVDSKYASAAYDKRSKIYRPKIRTVIRKNEAAAAAAFFSNMDVVSVSSQDPTSKEGSTDAEIMKGIVQYRLTKSIPWYQLVLGGLQDAQTIGVAIAHVYWEYEEEIIEDEEEEGDAEETPEFGSEIQVSQPVPPPTMGPPPGLPPLQAPQPGPTALPFGAGPPLQAPPGGVPATQAPHVGNVPPPGGVPLPIAGQRPPGAAAPHPPLQPVTHPPVAGGLPPMQPVTAGAPPPAPQGPAAATPPPGAPSSPGPGGAGPAAPWKPPKAPKKNILVDKPVVELIPVENLRIDPGSDWIDPINSSPYVIQLMPMYVQDVRDRIDEGHWLHVSDGDLLAAVDAGPDSTRQAREKGRSDKYEAGSREVSDYEMVWVQRHIHKKKRVDWEFYTLGDIAMLSEPQPLKKTVRHGKRPYIMGCCILETHRIYPSGIATLGKTLAEETNEVTNQRLDNIKFVLNKKWFVKRGKEADVPGLLRNVPGGVVMLDDPEKDVREINWQDVTGSSFEEQTRLGQEFNELLGNFDPVSTMQISANTPARNMDMLSKSSGTLTEYTLRTYVETFVQPVMRQLLLLEQHYETDQVVYSIAAKQSQFFKKYGMTPDMDSVLEAELTLNVNVGMGATDPQMKLQKFMIAMSSYIKMLKESIGLGMDMKEIGKEVFGHLGYSDGSRFFGQGDPEKSQMQAQIQQLTQQSQELMRQLKDKMGVAQVGLEKTKLSVKGGFEKQKLHEEHEDKRAVATHMRAIKEMDDKVKHNHLDHGQAMETNQLDHNQDLAMKRQAHVHNLEAKRQEMQHNLGTNHLDHAQALDQQERGHGQALDQQERGHDQTMEQSAQSNAKDMGLALLQSRMKDAQPKKVGNG